MTVPNPWHDLPNEAPYVLPSDRHTVEVFNRTAGANHRIHTNLLPEPFFGRLDAPVVVLLLNPGVGGDEDQLHQQPDFKKGLLAALTSDKGPHFHLRQGAHGPGHEWWRRVAGRLINDELIGQQGLANNLLCLEYFPYHSRSFNHTHLRLPSQKFTFDQVRGAMERKAIIITGRGFPIWCGTVPELASYEHLCMIKSRNAAITKGNITENKFDLIVEKLRAATNSDSGTNKAKKSRY